MVMKHFAAIDIGSMTARLLIAEKEAKGGMFRTISRGRGYTRLAEGFEEPETATIKPEAIEIAQLRLWLALVVDQTIEQARPLPNLDYKLMAGNSLIETIDGEPVLELFR